MQHLADQAKSRGHAQLAAQGKILLDCPVSGTSAQPANKDLVVFASGDEAAFERCREVLAGMSRAQKYVGAFANGGRMKFIANHLITIHNLASAEAFVLGEMAGLDPALVLRRERRQRRLLANVSDPRPDDGEGPVR